LVFSPHAQAQRLTYDSSSCDDNYYVTKNCEIYDSDNL
jgi:hypothetical protein